VITADEEFSFLPNTSIYIYIKYDKFIHNQITEAWKILWKVTIRHELTLLVPSCFDWKDVFLRAVHGSIFVLWRCRHAYIYYTTTTNYSMIFCSGGKFNDNIPIIRIWYDMNMMLSSPFCREWAWGWGSPWAPTWPPRSRHSIPAQANISNQQQ